METLFREHLVHIYLLASVLVLGLFLFSLMKKNTAPTEALPEDPPAPKKKRPTKKRVVKEAGKKPDKQKKPRRKLA